MTFASLGLSADLLRAISELSYSAPTPKCSTEQGMRLIREVIAGFEPVKAAAVDSD